MSGKTIHHVEIYAQACLIHAYSATEASILVSLMCIPVFSDCLFPPASGKQHVGGGATPILATYMYMHGYPSRTHLHGEV